MTAPIRLRFPETLHTDTLDFIDHRRDDMPPRVDPASLAGVWQESEGNSIWFEWGYDNQVAGYLLSSFGKAALAIITQKLNSCLIGTTDMKRAATQMHNG